MVTRIGGASVNVVRGITPDVVVSILGPLVWLALPATLWALFETVRVRSWRWVATVALLMPIGTLAWFIAGRRQYGFRGLRYAPAGGSGT